jgi:hypothetical protein
MVPAAIALRKLSLVVARELLPIVLRERRANQLGGPVAQCCRRGDLHGLDHLAVKCLQRSVVPGRCFGALEVAREFSAERLVEVVA